MRNTHLSIAPWLMPTMFACAILQTQCQSDTVSSARQAPPTTSADDAMRVEMRWRDETTGTLPTREEIDGMSLDEVTEALHDLSGRRVRARDAGDSVLEDNLTNLITRAHQRRVLLQTGDDM